MSTPSREELQAYYERRRQAVSQRALTPEERHKFLEAVHHEAFALDVIVGGLRSIRINHYFTLRDLNQSVRAANGTTREADFRIIIEGTPVLFGATRFDQISSPHDLRKNVQPVDIPVLSSTGLGVPAGSIRFTEVQKRTSVLRRKIAYRVAKEGRRAFEEDYVYVMFCYDKPADIWPDFISPTFQFEDPDGDNFFLKEVGVTGICLVSAWRGDDGRIDTSAFLVRTHTFPKAGNFVRRFLGLMDGVRVNW